MKSYKQASRISSPWSLQTRLGRLCFLTVWTLTCQLSPKFLYPYRNLVLRAFGATIKGKPFVASTARIHFPWNLFLDHEACIAARVDVYNLDVITLGERAVVAQDVMLCCGTHDFTSEKQELMTAPISIGQEAFIGARAIILPGVTVKDGAIVGAGSVLSQDAEHRCVYAGNPARLVRQRDKKHRAGSTADEIRHARPPDDSLAVVSTIE